MKRLFVSIPLPEAWRDALDAYDKSHVAHDVRWTAKENIHITVCFLGDVDEARIGEIQEKLKQVCARAEPFSLSFENISFAPQGMPPRMLWAMFQESAKYEKLVKETREMLKEFLAVEPHKDLIPHATLARFNDPRIARDIDVAKPYPVLSSFEVRAVELVESRLDPTGARYEKLETFSFEKEI